MSKKLTIKYKKERVVLSDLLPYELPLTFSNRHLYKFLVKNKIEYKNKNFIWLHTDSITDSFILILLGLDIKTELNTVELSGNIYKKLKKTPYMPTIPFSYAISHNKKQYRELSILHPKNQVQAIHFYDQFKELMIYYSNISKFSLRAPNSIAKCFYHDDKSKLQIFSTNETQIEEKGKEYKNLRSFFSYNKYSNIFKFYESKEYHRCEKQYNMMAKLDVSKCFDSIYTHSIAWAIFTKKSVKENLLDLKNTFPDQFDCLMQQMNYNETNGILIGPELSRIFAELIFQSIDNELFDDLKKQGVEHKYDYEIFRYVDDYFVFFNHNNIYDKVLRSIQFCLKNYKLYLNISKSTLFKKPIITNISIAKKQISLLINDKLKYTISTNEQPDSFENENKKDGKIYIRSGSLITDFKIILKINDVSYKDIINYSLSIVERKCRKIIKDYLSIEKTPSKNKELINAFLSILEFSFFIYSVTPRINSTIKLLRVLFQIVVFLRNNEVGKEYEHIIYKVIFDNIDFIMRKNRSQEHIQVETLYLLVFLSELGHEYWLDVDLLADYFGANEKNNKYQFETNLNYLSITVILFYMKEKKRYHKLKIAILDLVIEKFKGNLHQLHNDTELTLLFFDIIICPHVADDYKEKLLTLYSIDNPDQQQKFIQIQKNVFTKWTNFDFAKELDSKKSLNVY